MLFRSVLYRRDTIISVHAIRLAAKPTATGPIHEDGPRLRYFDYLGERGMTLPSRELLAQMVWSDKQAQ